MPPAIVFKDLEWKYEHTKEFALKGINLEIEEGTFLGIVGANEQGKTTLISCINGLIPHNFNGVYRGSVEVLGRTVREQDALDLAAQVGMVFADPESQFTAMTVEEELAFGLENMGFDLGKIEERLEWASEITMIHDLLDKSPYDISGGQKQRVSIASVLSMNAPIIIMDEPTSMIDPLGKQFIFDILGRLKEAGEHTLIVVEHNIEQLVPLADQLLLMDGGQVGRVGTPREFFDDPTFLVERGILVPEVTQFTGWMRDSGHLSNNTSLPLDLEGGVELTKSALDGKQA